jgi:16S rRNA (uracil1498-N3)-methyltransferase
MFLFMHFVAPTPLFQEIPMPKQRFFLPTTFTLGTSIEVQGEELHHLTRVMRNEIGDSVELINGKGDLAEGTITKILPKMAWMEISALTQEKPKNYSITLLQAIPKKNHLDFILEKGTELGVDHFYLIASQHSEKNSFTPPQMERMEHLLISATKQCGRLYLPSIQIFSSLQKLSSIPQKCFFGDLRKEAPSFISQLEICPLVGSFGFFIGPEKGFSLEELAYLENPYQAKGVSLHKNVLRTETAAIAALAILSHKLSLG